MAATARWRIKYAKSWVGFVLRVAHYIPQSTSNRQCKELALSLYTIQQVLTKRSVQSKEAFWALPAVDLDVTQPLQGFIASCKSPLQSCALQAWWSHWLPRATCGGSEQSAANDSTFPKMDTLWQSSRAIPASRERGGRAFVGTSLQLACKRAAPARYIV